MTTKIAKIEAQIATLARKIAKLVAERTKIIRRAKARAKLARR